MAWRLRPNPSPPAQLYDPFNWFDAAYPGKDKVRTRRFTGTSASGGRRDESTRRRAALAPSNRVVLSQARGRQVEINNGRLAMLGIFSLLSESAAPGAVPPLTLVNYIVDASGLTELNFPSIDLPVIGTVGGWAFLNSFPQYTPPADLSIVTAVSQFSTPGNALLGAVGN